MIHLKVITKHAQARPTAHALTDTKSVMTWDGFRQETERIIAFLLNHYGRELPRQAAYISQTRIEMMPWLAALTTLGIPFTGLDYSLSPAALNALNNSIGTDLLLLSTKSISQVDNVIALANDNAMIFDLDSLSMPFIGRSMADNRNVAAALLIENIGLQGRPYRAVGFTSGTTGLPKTVLRYESFDQRRFAYFAERYRFTSEDLFFSAMPAYHAAGNGWVRLFLSLGATVCISSGESPHEILNTLISKRITATVMTPVLLNQLVNEATILKVTSVPSLRWLLVGGKHLPAALKLRALAQLGPSLHEYYGTTETGVNTIAEPADIANYPSSVGKVYDGNAIAILDTARQPLPAGCSGSIAVDSYMNMASYGDGHAHAVELKGKRYLITPDQGYLDQEGRLFLLNRSDTPGNHDHLYRLEDAIRSLPDIEDVAILSENENAPEEVTCALKVASVDQPEATIVAQVRLLAEREAIKLHSCRVVHAIPYSPSGKVRIRDLKLLLSAA